MRLENLLSSVSIPLQLLQLCLQGGWSQIRSVCKCINVAIALIFKVLSCGTWNVCDYLPCFNLHFTSPLTKFEHSSLFPRDFLWHRSEIKSGHSRSISRIASAKGNYVVEFKFSFHCVFFGKWRMSTALAICITLDGRFIKWTQFVEVGLTPVFTGRFSHLVMLGKTKFSTSL